MYRGREGQWAFFLHRISGVAIILFLTLHVTEISSSMFGPKWFNALLKFEANPVFGLGLVGVAALVLYHALNGLRIIIMDFTSWGVKYHRQLWYGVWALYVVIGVPMLLAMLGHVFGGGE